MGRDATKAAGNPWYQARKKAAEYDDRLCSREGAAEQLGMSVSSLADAELGNTKFMPVDKAVGWKTFVGEVGRKTLMTRESTTKCQSVNAQGRIS